MKKKVFLAAAFFALMAVGVYAQTEADFDTTTGGDGKSIVITKYKGKATAVIIPATIKGLPVTGIGRLAFEKNKSITGVTIPNSVTSIGMDAFANCTGLTGMTIPNGVTSIEGALFYGCTGLTNVTIPDSVTSIGNSAFSNCTSLTSITIPNSVTKIEDYAFLGCTKLTGVTIPDSVTNIGTRAFLDCTGLTGVTIGNSVTRIGMEAFGRCKSLTAINVNTANTAYSSDNGVLYNKNKTILVAYPAGKTGAFTIPNNVTEIESNAFWGCIGLTGVTISNNVTNIGTGAFLDCTSLTDVTIPNSVTNIGRLAFYNCKNLANITIPDSVTSIDDDSAFGDTAWYNNQPNGVVYAGKVAHTYKGTMPANTRITILDGTKTIGHGAFKYNTNLIGITIPDSVISIGREAFKGCTKLTDITIPDSVISIGEDAFTDTAWYNNQPNKSVVYVGKIAYKYKGDMPANTSITLLNGTKIIDKYAFYDCTNLIGITIPDSVISIRKNAFFGCTNLIGITIPDSVISIEENAFGYCTRLTNITIPDSITGVHNSAFSNNTAWYNNQPDKSVVYLGKIAYTYKGDMPANTSITLLNGTKTIGEDAFIRTGIASLTIPNSVTSIQNNAFTDCKSLTSVTFAGPIPSTGFSKSAFNSLGDLYDKFYAKDKAKTKGTPGTYTRPDGNSKTWKKK